ncbi:MAG: cytochrome P450 [Gammaproteobacteria bacterium]|nr:cytochrome P450 [Gammaproteobacteria bacterium]
MSALAHLPQLDVDPFDAEVLRAPGSYHESLRTLGCAVALPRYGVVASGRIAGVEQVFRDWRTFTSARGVGLADFAAEPPWRPPSIVLEVDPPAHERTRRVLARALAPAAVARLRATMARTAVDYVERALAAGTVDGARELAQAFPLEVFGDAVGLDDGPRENLLRYGAMVFNALGPDNAMRRRALAAADEVVPWIAAKCTRPALREGGFGAAIHAAAADGDISADEAALLVRSLLSAGIDTTVATLAFALDAFARHPAQWSRLRAKPALIPAAIDEVLRWASPVHTFCRTSTRDCVIGDAPVPAGTKVLCVIAAANRDPARWEDADRFDIARPRRPHAAFGSGIHVCVGQHVARQEVTVLLEALVARVARIEPAGAAVLEPGNSVNGIAALPLALYAD